MVGARFVAHFGREACAEPIGANRSASADGAVGEGGRHRATSVQPEGGAIYFRSFGKNIA